MMIFKYMHDTSTPEFYPIINITQRQLLMPPSHNNSSSIPLLCLILAFTCVSATVFKVYPLGDDYFEKVYLVNHNDREYYLTISCKEQNMLSISLTTSREFIEYPPFNIYGNSENRPKLARGVYTFLQECHAFVQVNTERFLQVKRGRDGETIFALGDLFFSDNHNRFTVFDESAKWGLGERFQKNFHVSDGKWTIWNRDKPWKIDEGKDGVSEQTYGHHPLYLARERQSKLYHISYFKNTNGLFIESRQNSNQLLYHSIGGPIHFILILGNANPEQVLEKYHEYIGRGHIPPFWSFGHHQCRWGYKSLAQIRDVVHNYNKNNIPLDVFWSDLEYMDKKMIFTVNEGSHPSHEINSLMKDEDMHFVPLLDVGVSVHDNVAMAAGKEMNVFFKNPNNNNEYYTAEVWPGNVHFVDYLNPNATNFWKSQMDRLYKKVAFSGIWLDMNEPSNFRGGEFIDQPFRIQQNENLNMMTISSNLNHYNENNPAQPLKHKEVHAYYGHLSTVPTYEFLSEHGRPFIISRSTSVGSGHFVGHWTGDNVATWDFLRLSISGNFLFQIFGIQMVGADICGFYLDTTEEMCARWHQVGAFYPFARNHNHEEARSQEPYAFGQVLLETSRASIKTRYALLKQLYSIYLMKKGKGSYYRPLSFEFYEDELAYEKEAIETQVLIGRSIMTAPIVYQGQESRPVYFPGAKEEWWQFQIDYKTGKVSSEKTARFAGNTKETILNPLPSAPPTFLRAGFLLLSNYPENRSSKLSTDFHLFAALREGAANGTILAIEDFNDESKIQKCISANCLYHISIRKTGSDFTVSWWYEGSGEIRGTLKIKSMLVVVGEGRWRSEAQVAIASAEGSRTVGAQELK